MNPRKNNVFVPRFTGKCDAGKYWYKGQLWVGDTNRIGDKALIRKALS